MPVETQCERAFSLLDRNEVKKMSKFLIFSNLQ